jgi:gamma-glutamylcyclotransferase (GGCT)/AIG2-like uncharacterized protein YtfP
MAKLAFMYGTLKSGYNNNRLLQGARFLGKGITVGKFKVAGKFSFPMAKKDDNGDLLSGEIYEVDQDHINKMDWLESNGRFYQREIIKVKTERGEEANCWMYIFLGNIDNKDMLQAENGVITWER